MRMRGRSASGNENNVKQKSVKIYPFWALKPYGSFMALTTTAHHTGVCQRVNIRWYTLSYAGGTFGLSCIHFKYGGIRREKTLS